MSMKGSIKMTRFSFFIWMIEAFKVINPIQVLCFLIDRIQVNI